MTTTEPITLDPIKTKHRAMWALGNYDNVATEVIQSLGTRIVEAAGIAPGDRVLDVAAGSGNASLPAARAGGQVWATDITPELLETGRQRAEAAGLDITWREGDAEHLPCEDAEYDAVLSLVGVMFAPFHQPVADELLRVTKTGGTIALVNWTPEGFIGHVFRTIGKYVPPPAGVKPPSLWGSEQRLNELFGDGISELTINRRMFVFRYRSAEHWLDVFRTYYGPILKAFGALDAAGQAGLTHDLTELLQRFNQGGSATLAVPSEYLEVVATRR